MCWQKCRSLVILSPGHPSVNVVTSQLDPQPLWQLHGRHHWRSGGPLSRAGPEAEPQARPERAARIWRSAAALRWRSYFV